MMFNEAESEFLRVMNGESQDYRAYEEAKEQDTLESYRKYLQFFPNGMYEQEVKLNIENFIQNDHNTYEEAIKSDGKQAFEEYLNQYPNGLHIKEAKNKIDEFVNLEKEKNTYLNAINVDRIEIYEAYLKEYPQGLYVNTVKEKIELIITEQKKREVEAEKLKELEEEQRREQERTETMRLEEERLRKEEAARIQKYQHAVNSFYKYRDILDKFPALNEEVNDQINNLDNIKVEDITKVYLPILEKTTLLSTKIDLFQQEIKNNILDFEVLDMMVYQKHYMIVLEKDFIKNIQDSIDLLRLELTSQNISSVIKKFEIICDEFEQKIQFEEEQIKQKAIKDKKKKEIIWALGIASIVVIGFFLAVWYNEVGQYSDESPASEAPVEVEANETSEVAQKDTTAIEKEIKSNSQTKKYNIEKKDIKWFFPEKKECIAQNGEIDENTGLCYASKLSAKDICSNAKLLLPGLKDFDHIAKQCNILNVDFTRSNQEMWSYTSCYQEKGFTDENYWSNNEKNWYTGFSFSFGDGLVHENDENKKLIVKCIQPSILDEHNIETFLIAWLNSGCFSDQKSVADYFSENIDMYYDLHRPSREQIFNKNLRYCQKWQTMSYELISYSIDKIYGENDIENAIVNVKMKFTLSNEYENKRGISKQKLHLIIENGQIKIKDIYLAN